MPSLPTRPGTPTRGTLPSSTPFPLHTGTNTTLGRPRHSSRATKPRGALTETLLAPVRLTSCVASSQTSHRHTDTPALAQASVPHSWLPRAARSPESPTCFLNSYSSSTASLDPLPLSPSDHHLQRSSGLRQTVPFPSKQARGLRLTYHSLEP